MKKYVTFCIVNSFGALSIGLFIYLAFRGNTFLNVLFQANALLGEARLAFYIPDFLWGYALCFSLSIFCKSHYAGIISIFFGITLELLQNFKIIKGTFDYIDILMYITANIIAVLIIILFNRREKNDSIH